MLELETRLQKERERLGELRKKHYELAGVAEGWGDEEGESISEAPPTVLLTAPPTVLRTAPPNAPSRHATPGSH